MKVGDLVRVKSTIVMGPKDKPIGIIVKGGPPTGIRDTMYIHVMFCNGAIEFFHELNVEVISESR